MPIMAKPRLLLDENIGHVTETFLVRQGYDTMTIGVSDAGLRDEFVLQKAVEEQRVLITLDKDFGRLVYQQSQHHVGVVFLRPKKESGENIKNLVVKILATHSQELEGKFVVATETKIRIR